MHQLLNPRSIALVGASDESPWSQGFMKNLRTFDGEIHLVNPRRQEAFGRKVAPSLADIGRPVDHAAVLVAASRVPDVLRDAAAAGVRSATVIASGFGEGDGAGTVFADEVAEICAEHDIAIIGPNCYGFNNYAGTYISRFMIDVPDQPGTIGLSFQSGQLGAATADAASARGIHLRYVVSSGNELVVDTNDYLEYFLGSDDVTVMGGVFERIPDPERFERIALAAIDAGKPIVALKPGRSAAASRIAVAHTGAVTGADAITDAYFEDLGIIRVGSVEELAETAGLLAKRGWPQGARTAFFGFSGGASELFADEADGTSIVLEPHTPETLAKLAEVSTLPASVIHNPFDMTVDGAVHY
ncbi:MAG: CoA-binding protein, partial [Aeromicrobium sp.]